MGNKEDNPNPEGGSENNEPDQEDELDKETLQQRIDELEKQNEELEDQIDPNYRKLRNKAKKADELESKLEENGFEINDDGEVVEKEEGSGQLSEDEVESLVERKTQEVNVRREKNSQLRDIEKKFDKDTKESVEDIFDRLTQGRDLDVSEVDDYIEKAKRAVGVEISSSSSSGRDVPAGFSGRGPRTEKPGGSSDRDFGAADTEEAEEARKDLFEEDYVSED